MRLVAALALAVLAGGAARAAPPPPPVYPSDWPKTINGYDLPVLYAVYYNWVGRGRESALRKAMPIPDTWEGKTIWAVPAESRLDHDDFGVIRIDRLERYCTGDWTRQMPPSDCVYRYRYAFVPNPTFGDKAITRRIQESFRPEILTALMSNSGLQSLRQNQLWSDDRLRQVFARHTDLAEFYKPFVELHDVSSSTCPAFQQQLARLGSLELSVSPEKARPYDDIPAPHGAETRIRLQATTAAGGTVTVEGTRSLYTLMEPIWNAVEGCSKPSYKN